MLLALNINNTQIKVGGYRGSDLLVHWRIATDLNKTDDEYAMILRGLFQYAGLEFAKAESAAISSVVPPLTEVFERLCQRYFGVTALVVGPGVRRMRAELGGRAAVVATGGWAELVVEECRCFDHLDPLLTLEGLRIIYERNRMPLDDPGSLRART